MPTTTSTEDYLERIYTLIQGKGYARVVDIASSLQVQPSSVTKMIQKLDEQELVRYEKYRGLVLTSAGEAIAKAVRRRHLKLEEFLRMLGVAEPILQRDIEGLEHHLSQQTIERIHDLIDYFQENPEHLAELRSRRHKSSHFVKDSSG
ncbi:MAG TPA: transcriptional regulator MntR [Candidatus Fraserbacteria bacterium]|nr:transcriptional regulator MntR [Candidatus Fraserbacteria bacterium]